MTGYMNGLAVFQTKGIG